MTSIAPLFHRPPPRKPLQCQSLLGCGRREAAGVEGGRRLKLTKLEVKMMEEARKKQKENIVQPQVTIVAVVVVVAVWWRWRWWWWCSVRTLQPPTPILL
jgi:hypothetical protein